MRTPIKTPNVRTQPDEFWIESRVNQGMITTIDPADIPNSALRNVLNANIRFDKTSRRSGHIHFTPNEPDANRVLKLATLADNQGNSYTFRVSPVGIHELSGVNWTILTGALSGGVNDRIQTVVFNNGMYLSNNGADFIQKINPTGLSYARAGNAPKYRFITGFADRLVAANRTDGGSYSVEVGWSAQGNADEWDSATDETAGSTPLSESPSDFADPITGIFGFSNSLVIIRSRSIWLASRNPVGSNPFNFYNAVPGIGTQSPYSVAVFEQGICFLDLRTGHVWSYTIGGSPDNIGLQVENEIIKSIDDPATVFSSYNPIDNEYILCTPVPNTTLVKAWTYNFRNKSWSYAEIDGICSVDDADISTGYTSIDDLIGTIDQQSVTIDELSPAAKIRPTRTFGKTDGNIIQADANATTDDNNAYTTVLDFKRFEFEDDEAVVHEIRIDFSSVGAFRYTLSIDKDGKGLIDARSNVIVPGDDGRTRIIRHLKQYRCRQFTFRLAIDDGPFQLLKYAIRVTRGGDAKQ